jgi:hydroxymethylglutaryl-CoA lyase
VQTSEGKRLYIHEVAPRDGFQIEAQFVPTERKIELINTLGVSGLAKIEVTSFTSPKAIPALRDAELVMARIWRNPDIEYSVLVPNVRGAERAIACKADELNLVISASESHNLANLGMTCEKSLSQIATIVAFVGGQTSINVSLSTAFGCPFEGDVKERRVLEFIARFEDLGISRVSLCDTIGVANPAQVERLFRALVSRFPHLELTAHFHNTRGMGLANAIAALEAGVVRFDASLGGLGGCPYAPGASGNVCTEDLVHMLEAMGYRTHVDLERLLECARTLPSMIGHDIPGQIIKAGCPDRRYPMPEAGPGERPAPPRYAGRAQGKA